MSADGLSEQMAKRAVNQLADLAHDDPQKTVRLLSMAEHVAPEGLRREVRGVRRLFEEDAPGGDLLLRALQQTNAKVRHRFVDDFIFHNVWGRGQARREAAEERYGFRPPFVYLVSPSMRCNLHCQGCYAAEYCVDDDLPIEVIDRVLEEGKELGIHFVTILGGEPFLRRDMWDVYAQHNDIYFLVFSNGTTLTPANVARLGELGNVAVALSIEGWEADTDARRGPGTYASVREAFDRMRDAGILFGFSSMVTRYNVETICSDEFNQMLVDKGCLFGWHFLYMPIGRDPDLNLMPTPEQRNYLRMHGAARIRTTFPMFVIDFWNDAPYVDGCIAAGKGYFHVNTNGDVEPCIFTHFATDNVNEKSLEECLNSPFFQSIRSRQPYGSNLLMPCMLIDHPHVFREVYAEAHPVPTHAGAEQLINELAEGLDDYSRRERPILDRAWQEDFIAKGFGYHQESKNPIQVQHGEPAGESVDPVRKGTWRMLLR